VPLGLPDEAEDVEALTAVGRKALVAGLIPLFGHPFAELAVFFPHDGDVAVAEAVYEGGEVLELDVPAVLVPLVAGHAATTWSFPHEADGVEAGDALGAERAFAAELGLGATPVAEGEVLGLGDVGVAVLCLVGAESGVAEFPEVRELLGGALERRFVVIGFVRRGGRGLAEVDAEVQETTAVPGGDLVAVGGVALAQQPVGDGMGAEITVAVAADEVGELGEMPFPLDVFVEGLLMLVGSRPPHVGIFIR